MGTTALDDVLEAIGDGTWHDVYDIDKRLPVETKKILIAIEFLAKHELILVQRGEEGEPTAIRLTEPVKEWYAKTREGGL